MKTIKDIGDKYANARKFLAQLAGMDTQSDELSRKKASDDGKKKSIEESVRMGEYEVRSSQKEQTRSDEQSTLGSEFWFG